MSAKPEVETYEYYLKFWGEIQNDDQLWIKRDLGINGTDFWFDTKAEREEFKNKLTACADSHRCVIAFTEYEGCDVRLRTVVRMVMHLPDGRKFPYEYDFGYGYDSSLAEYVFTDGNYGCDCNRSIFLENAGRDVEEFECGESILVEDFKVTKE